MANKLLVEVPDVAPAIGGLLHHANIITERADSAAFHGVQHEVTLDGQTRIVPAPGTDKTFDQIAYVDGVEFSLYRGVEGALLVDAKPIDIAKAAFERGESYAVEGRVQELLFNPVAVDITPTPGTPVTNLRYALGLLEQYAAANIAGAPLIHGNRVGVTLIPELIGEGADLRTIHSTPVVNGGGYAAKGPAVSPAPAGAAWLYISGRVNLWQGTLGLQATKDLPANRQHALAERTYAATVDGPVAAILVGI